VTDFGPLAEAIYRQKYSWDGEDWPDTVKRVVDNVVRPYLPHLADDIEQAILERKFIPGGRYLFAAGKKLHQTQNCLLLTVEDSREGWSDLMRRITAGLMSGAGIGVVYSKLRPKGAYINGTGGESTGPLALMQMVNEAGRHIRQGGARRSAIWAGLHWNHPDIKEFIRLKDWPPEMKAAKEADFDAPATMDGTNISVILDDAFFWAYHDPTHPDHTLAQEVYWDTVEHMLTTGEPGFSVDVGENAGEHLRNAPVTADTHVLTDKGYRKVGEILDEPVTIWTGKRWAEQVKFTRTMISADIVKVSMTGGREIRCEPTHEFLVERYRGKGGRKKLVGIERIKAGDLKPGDILHVSMPETGPVERDSEFYTLGWLYGDGSFSSRHRTHRAELTLCSEASKSCLPYITGYNKITTEDSRGYTRLYWYDGFKGCSKDKAPKLETLPQIVSFVAGVFDADGNWEPSHKRIRLASKHKGFLRDIARMLESVGILSNISKAGISTYGKSQCWQLVIAAGYSKRFAELIPTVRIRPDLEGYKPYRESQIKVLSVTPDGTEDVFCADVGVEEHSFMAEGVIISNCTEVTSRDDNDICNLGSLNLARIESKEEFSRLVRLGTAFLLCGSIYSMVPYEEVEKVREKNRRLGLGLMGIGEWLAVRGKPYGPDAELEEWLKEYAKSGEHAKMYADILGVSHPIKTRAIAPAGTISILGETTSGMEPMFAPAYRRRYAKGDTWVYQYVIDSAAERLAARGIDPDTVDCAYTLAQDPERRVKMQVWLQKFVDHGISSTINLPAPEQQEFTVTDFGTMLIKYLPYLRGITTYPDGARGGQPLTVVPYAEAKDWVGVEIEEVGNENACVGGVCGI